MNIINEKVGILTCHGFDLYKNFDKKIIDNLIALGITTEHVVWDDPSVYWRDFKIILVRSTWDYFQKEEKLKNFLSVLTKINNLGISIINSLELIKWNCKKTYLKDLKEIGIPVIDTLWLNKNQLNDMKLLIAEKKWAHCVVKPVLSGGGKHTINFTSDKSKEIAKECLLLNEEEWMVQPFVEEIIKEGEYSFIFLEKEFSHCVLKKPGEGNFIASPLHGGSIHSFNPSPGMLEQAKKILDLMPFSFLYVRMDAISRNDKLVVMEIEMIEPYLFDEYTENFIGKFNKHFVPIISKLFNKS